MEAEGRPPHLHKIRNVPEDHDVADRERPHPAHVRRPSDAAEDSEHETEHQGPREDVQRGPHAPQQEAAVLPDDRPAPVVVVLRAGTEEEIPDDEGGEAAPDEQERAALPRRLEPLPPAGGGRRPRPAQEPVSHRPGRTSLLWITGGLALRFPP